MLWIWIYFDKIFRGCMILELVTALKHIVETLLGGQPFEVGDACNQPGTLYTMNLLKNETKKVDSEANSTDFLKEQT